MTPVVFVQAKACLRMRVCAWTELKVLSAVRFLGGLLKRNENGRERFLLSGRMQFTLGFHEPVLQFAFAARVFPAADGGRAGSDVGGEFLNGQVHF
jgi:hypothetical protein